MRAIAFIILLAAAALPIGAFRTRAPRRRARIQASLEASVDVGVIGFSLASLGLAAGTGAMLYSVSAGKRGLANFMGQEKPNNWFYQRQGAPERDEDAAPLQWLNDIIPKVSFVEVYGREEDAPEEERPERTGFQDGGTDGDAPRPSGADDA